MGSQDRTGLFPLSPFEPGGSVRLSVCAGRVCLFGSARVYVCVCVCVCTPKGRHVTRNMSENTGVSVGGTAFAFFFNQKLNIFLFVFFSSLFLDCECCEFLFWFLYSLLKNH